MKSSAQLVPHVLWWCLILMAGLYACAALRIVLVGHDDDAAKSADAAIVLGAAAWGNKPSPVYRERILEAVTLYQSGKVRWIILTGGSPRPGYPSEARVGQQYCVAKGVPLEATLVDEASRTTWQNLQAAKDLMKRHGIRDALLVSDPLHMARAMSMAQGLGLPALAAPTQSSRFRSWLTQGKFLWRETWLYLAYAVFGVKD